MQVKLHANATTTPKIRTHIQQSTLAVAALAAELGVSETTIRRWRGRERSEEHTSELQSLMRISYAVFCLKKKNQKENKTQPQYRRKRSKPQTNAQLSIT